MFKAAVENIEKNEIIKEQSEEALLKNLSEIKKQIENTEENLKKAESVYNNEMQNGLKLDERKSFNKSELERLQKEAEAEAKAIGEARGRAIGEARGRAIGEAKGRAIGEAIGEERLSTLLNRLIMDGRSAEIQSVVTNAETRKRLYKEYGILSE